jgi:quinol monooxygenase YgiN
VTIPIYIFARFHSREGKEHEVADAIRTVLPQTAAEPGCLAIQAFRSIRDERLFFIHSRWKDEAAFELHAALPHTVRFLERVEAAIDHPLDVNRTVTLDSSGPE